MKQTSSKQTDLDIENLFWRFRQWVRRNSLFYPEMTAITLDIAQSLLDHKRIKVPVCVEEPDFNFIMGGSSFTHWCLIGYTANECPKFKCPACVSNISLINANLTLTLPATYLRVSLVRQLLRHFTNTLRRLPRSNHVSRIRQSTIKKQREVNKCLSPAQKTLQVQRKLHNVQNDNRHFRKEQRSSSHLLSLQLPKIRFST